MKRHIQRGSDINMLLALGMMIFGIWARDWFTFAAGAVFYVTEEFKLALDLNPTSLSKYFNQKTEYGGRSYASKAEAEFACYLALLKSARAQEERVESWQPQVRFPIVVNGEKVCDYIVDFQVRYADGREDLVEVKGFWTDVAKLKVKLFRATYLRDHPDINYRIVK